MQNSIGQRMQETLSDRRSRNLSTTQTTDAVITLLDSGCRKKTLSDSGRRRHSIRLWMHDTLFETADAGVSYQTANAGVSLSDSGCMIYSIRQQMQYSFYQEADAGNSMRQRMQEPLFQTADAGVSLSDIGCRTLLQAVDAGDTLSDSRCKTKSIRQRMQCSLYQTANAGVSVIISDSRFKKTNNGCMFLSYE